MKQKALALLLVLVGLPCILFAQEQESDKPENEIVIEGIRYQARPDFDYAIVMGLPEGRVRMRDLTIQPTIRLLGRTWQVREIGNGAFSGSPLYSIVIPNTITKIGSKAFYASLYLKKIRIPGSVKEIDGTTFTNSHMLEEVIIENGPGRIGHGAFAACESLHTILIPESVKQIDDGAFSGCTALKAITLPSRIKVLSSRVFERSGLTECVIPPSVTKICNWAFLQCKDLKSVIIPSSVAEIESGAFDETGLETIVIPNSVKTIGEGAFTKCNLLHSVTINSDFNDLGKLAAVFIECPKLINYYGGGNLLANFKFVSSAEAVAKENAAVSANDYIDENGVNQGAGVAISGTVWAPVNCGYEAEKYPMGKLYQWGRKYGHGYGAPYLSPEQFKPYPKADATSPKIVESKAPLSVNASAASANNFYANEGNDTWMNASPQAQETAWNAGTEEAPRKSKNDPCPKGWRVPTYKELNTLKMNVSPVMVENGQPGRRFSGTVAYSSAKATVFLPIAGSRTNEGLAYGRGQYAFYWCSLTDEVVSGKCLQFYDKISEIALIHFMMSSASCPVRCVQE